MRDPIKEGKGVEGDVKSVLNKGVRGLEVGATEE